MNEFVHLLKLPWLASWGPSRWIAGAAGIIVIALVPLVAALHPPGSDWVMACAGIWCVALGLLWLLVMPNALWLARDARALRLPTIARLANASALVYAVLGVIVPALLLGAAGGHTLILLVAFTLVSAGCLGYLLLPSTIGSLLLLAFIALQHSPVQHALAGPSGRLIAWGAPAALVLAAVVTGWWIHLRRASSLDAGVLGRPLAWQFHLARQQGYASAVASARAARRNSSALGWFKPRPNLRRIGPSHPVASIRMALGRSVMPQTLPARVLHALYALAIIALGWLFLTYGANNQHAGPLGVSLEMLVGACIGLGVGIVSAQILPIKACWSGRRAELPLLALLPGLGAPHAVKRAAARACLAGSLSWLGIALVVLWAIEIASHVPGVAAGFTLLFLLAGMALTAASLLGYLSGRPLSVPTWTGGCAALLVLIAISFPLAQWLRHVGPLAAIVVLWLALLAWFGVLAWQRWTALQLRPHPFLADDS